MFGDSDDGEGMCWEILTIQLEMVRNHAYGIDDLLRNPEEAGEY